MFSKWILSMSTSIQFNADRLLNHLDPGRSELGPEYADLELRDLDPRNIVRKHIAEAMEEAGDEDARPRRRGLRPLGPGEIPPYDVDAT